MGKDSTGGEGPGEGGNDVAEVETKKKTMAGGVFGVHRAQLYIRF